MGEARRKKQAQQSAKLRPHSRLWCDCRNMEQCAERGRCLWVSVGVWAVVLALLVVSVPKGCA